MDILSYTSKLKEDIFSELGTSEQGISKNEAKKRLQRFGPNALPCRHTSGWKILGRQFASSFVYLLIVAALIAFFLQEFVNAAIIFLFVGINATLGFIQEYRSERTVHLLERHLVSRVKVRRGRADEFIDSRELVPGDVAFVEAGDILPADLRFFRTRSLLVNESVLTGESKVAEKREDVLVQAASTPFEASNLGFMGTVVESGWGEAVVLATGKNAAMGEISTLTEKIVKESAFEKKLRKFSRFVLAMVAGVAMLLVLSHVLTKKESFDIGSFSVFVIALSVSVIPEALPVVMIFSLSHGARRLSKKKVIAKRLSAIEDLGGIQVLCTDKTGTLTENHLRIEDVFSENKSETLFFGVLSSLFFVTGKSKYADPFDRALWERLPFEDQARLKVYQEKGKIPFDPTRRKSSVLVDSGENGELIVRGAPELIAYASNLPQAKLDALLRWVEDKGRRGMRVMAIGKKNMPQGNYSVEDENSGLTFLGCVSFTDPIKESAWEAIQRAKQLGVQFKIITGDSKEVSGTVAFKLGLIQHFDHVVTGDELSLMSEAEQLSAVEKHHVFARILPEQKYRIIELLQRKYEVGFLGEGINDAPALKIASVALAVSGATDIAQDAADIVLLEKNLNVIMEGVQEGRKVFANTMKYVLATLSSNFGNFFAIALSSLFVPFLPMLPLQILVVNLLSDFPMISISNDNVERSALRRPQSYNFKEIAVVAILLGLVSMLFDFAFFRLFFQKGEVILQTSWFMGSILTEILLLYSIRTRRFFIKGSRPSWVLVVPTLAVFLITLILPFTEIGRRAFGFQVPALSQLLLIGGVALSYFIVTEGMKLLYYRFWHHRLVSVN